MPLVPDEHRTSPATARAYAAGRAAGWSDALDYADRQHADAIDALERTAGYWYYVANNPEDVRAEHARTLALFDTARGKVADEQWRARLDELQRTDPLEYTRQIWHRLERAKQ